MHVMQLAGPGWLMYRTRKQWYCNPKQKMNRCASGRLQAVSERMQLRVMHCHVVKASMATMVLRAMCNACLVLVLVVSVIASQPATTESQCAWDTHMSTSQVSGKNTGRVIDISVTINKELPCWEKPDGLGAHRELVQRQDRGGVAFVSKLSLVVHTGTHFDAPSHFLQEAFDSGRGIEAIQLSIMNGSYPVCMLYLTPCPARILPQFCLAGPAVVVDIPHNSNITGKAQLLLSMSPLHTYSN